MSRHRDMLLMLVRLGHAHEQIAGEVPISMANLTRTLRDDWPVQPKYIAPLQEFAEEQLRRAWTKANEPDKEALAYEYMCMFGSPVNLAPRLSRAARRAAYCAWLIEVPPTEIFPLGIDCDDDSNDHIDAFVWQRVRALLEEARRYHDGTTAAVLYIETLEHAYDVLENREDPAENDWFQNLRGYRRGTYTFPLARRKPETDE